jgi:16S rRNA processing protein RimM
LRVRISGSGHHLREGTEPVVNGARRRILAVRQTPKGLLVDLEGVGIRREADALRGAELVLDRSELDELDEGEFYVGDLIGLTVLDEAGRELGTVAETFETPAHEVLVVRSGDRSVADLYIPFTHEHVPEVSLEDGRIVARLPGE